MKRQTASTSKTLAIFVLFLAFSAAAWALTSPFKNLHAIAAQVGFLSASNTKSVRTLKIAILDNGFKNFAAEIGKSLPANTVYHAGPVPVDPAGEETHGLYMAELVAGLLSEYAPGVGFELHLYSAFGYSNLESAVSDVIKQNFDLVLYAQVWEYGGSGDGRGFINALVNRALQAGIVWINAAGNFASQTFRAPVAAARDNWVKLPSANDTVRVRCENKNAAPCPLRVVLSWNDFSDQVDTGTEKDLDLILTDDTLKIVGSSALQQMKQIPEGSIGASLYPREIINQQVEPGLYFLRVKMRSLNFDKAKDLLRLTVSGDGVKLLDPTAGETLLSPADNPGVITVGAFDSVKSSNSARFKKPELLAPSLVQLQNGDQYLGSSNAAAITVAAAAILKAGMPGIKRTDLLKALSGEAVGSVGEAGQGLSLEVLKFQSAREFCFQAVAFPARASSALREFVRQFPEAGAVAVMSSRGVKIFTARDPFPLTNTYRVSPDDMLVAGPQGFEALPRSNQEYLPNGFFEVVQVPLGQLVCASPNNSSPRGLIGKRLRLPKNR